MDGKPYCASIGPFFRAALVNEKEITALGRDISNNQIFSTPAMIAIERQLLDAADQLRTCENFKLRGTQIDTAIRTQTINQGFSLSDEQIEGLYGVCQTSLDIIQGVAGSGKSTSMRALKLAYEAAGYSVMGATIARQAANQLEAETGIKSRTIAKLLTELDQGRIDLNNTVLVIDEAGQVSTHDMLRLIEVAQQSNSKLVLVGEEKQLDAIKHGGCLRVLSQRNGFASIESIRRQRDLWAREAVMNLRNGNALDALSSHNERGLLHLSDTTGKALQLLLRHWQDYTENNPGKNSMILAQRWRDVQSLNELVRHYYQDQGTLGMEDIETDCLVSDHVMRIRLSVGERVRFSRNDYRRGFTNGDLGTIESIKQLDSDMLFNIRCDDGRSVSFKESDYSDEQGRLYLAHAYASTVYSSQGSTVDGDTFVYWTSGMDRPASYVAGSRHKDSCHWYANREEIDALAGAKDLGVEATDQDRIATMARRMSTNRNNYLAIEYLDDYSLNDGIRDQENVSGNVPLNRELVVG